MKADNFDVGDFVKRYKEALEADPSIVEALLEIKEMGVSDQHIIEYCGEVARAYTENHPLAQMIKNNKTLNPEIKNNLGTLLGDTVREYLFETLEKIKAMVDHEKDGKI